MKPISVLAAVASIAVLSTAACKKNEPATSETNTTGATVQPEQPATEPVTPPPVQPQVTTGTATDTTTSDQSGMRQNTQTSGIHKGKDAGVASDFPSGGSDLIDRDHQYNSKQGTATPPNGTTGGQQGSSAQGSSTTGQQGSANAKQGSTNHSTPLGDSESGQYTGGKGTYGGKATWGTGPKKDTKMDQPTTK